MRLTASSLSWLAPPLAPAGGRSIEGGLLDARVTHVRQKDERYVLTHRLNYLRLPVSDLAHLPWPWLAYNRRALAVVRDRDYGDGRTPLADWIAAALRTDGGEPPDGRIDLLTLPRVAGLTFNPVSFWLCHDREGGLRAVLAEVNSTFGERHCYLCRKADGSVIREGDRIPAQKLMYVSPFLTVEGTYQFRFHETADRLGIFISLVQGGRTVLFASIVGRMVPLTAPNLVARLIRQPIPALRVLFLIHMHAARLYLRGLRLAPRSPMARALVSSSDGPQSHPSAETKCPP